MIVTKENIDEIKTITESQRGLVRALLKDVDEFNELVGKPMTDKSFVWTENFFKICITWQDHHDEYSPENLEAPDYYGLFRICIQPDEDNPSFVIPFSTELTLEELDTNICTLVSYFSDSDQYTRDKRAKAEEAWRISYEEKTNRQKAAKEKYKDYVPQVGDLCMVISTESEWYRIAGGVSIAIISRIEGDDIYVKNVNLSTMKPYDTEATRKYVIDDRKANKNIYTTATHNDHFAIWDKPESSSKKFGGYLISRWMAVELVDEFYDSYKDQKTGQRYFWHSIQLSRVRGTTIMKYLEKLKKVLVDGIEC